VRSPRCTAGDATLERAGSHHGRPGASAVERGRAAADRGAVERPHDHLRRRRDRRPAEREGARGLLVDGSRWRSGEASASIADQAQRLYGDRYAEFLDGVRAYAFFPLAVVRDAPPSGDLRISVRFYPIEGRIDQAAGIAFAIQPDGSYLGVRANALEDNALFFRVERGRRSILETIRGVETSTHAWHTLVLELRGTALRATLDDHVIYEPTLDAVPTGHVGLWSKADSQVLFDDLRIESLAP
jgi:hypothetical protein